jgi:hypothetical protein
VGGGEGNGENKVAVGFEEVTLRISRF